MRAKVVYVNLIEVEKNNEVKHKFVFRCEAQVDENVITTYSGSYSEDYARKYFEYCGVEAKNLVGTEVDITLDKNEKSGKDYIRFMNCLDKEGNAIIMSKTSNNTTKSLPIDF